MSRDPYRSSAGDLGRGGGSQRWDTERFEFERDRNRFGERDVFEERDTSFRRSSASTRGRDRSVDGLYERRGGGGGGGGGSRIEDDRFRERVYYDEPEFERESVRSPRERETVTIEKERKREVYSPSPSRRGSAPRPGLVRRQSSLDTYDRKPLPRYLEREERYGPPARREDFRAPPYVPIPLPRSRALPPPRRYAERDIEEVRLTEPDLYGDDGYGQYPERIREREIIRTRRRSRSKESKHGHSVKGSVRSSSVGSGSSSSSTVSRATTIRSEFPKKGKTRMPARLVSKQAIIALGYPFIEEGEVIVIQKALGRENIDEVIKLSEEYKSEPEMTGGRSEGGTIIEERREEIIEIPSTSSRASEIEVDRTTIIERSPSPARSHTSHATSVSRATSHHTSHHSHHGHEHGPLVVMAGQPTEEILFERSDDIVIGPTALAAPRSHSHSHHSRSRSRSQSRDDRTIRAEIRALEAERDAARAERRLSKELRKGGGRVRREGRESGELVIYEERTERIRESEGPAVVKIEKDRKGPNPKLVRAMLATLT